MAQGVITGPGVGAGTSGGSGPSDRKRAREDGSPGPSKRRTGSRTKNKETQRILESLMAGEYGSSVKSEPRSSPIDVDSDQAAGEVIDLTLED